MSDIYYCYSNSDEVSCDEILQHDWIILYCAVGHSLYRQFTKSFLCCGINTSEQLKLHLSLENLCIPNHTTSSLYVATLLHSTFPPDADEVFDEASALLELEQLKKRVGELEKKLGGCTDQRKPKGLKFLVRNMPILHMKLVKCASL